MKKSLLPHSSKLSKRCSSQAKPIMLKSLRDTRYQIRKEHQSTNTSLSQTELKVSGVANEWEAFKAKGRKRDLVYRQTQLQSPRTFNTKADNSSQLVKIAAAMCDTLKLARQTSLGQINEQISEDKLLRYNKLVYSKNPGRKSNILTARRTKRQRTAQNAARKTCKKDAQLQQELI